MLLGVKTDNPIAELYLYDGVVQVATMSWQADRELAHHLLKKIDEFLSDNGQSLDSVTGLFVFQGPGSFTGLRIGLTVMNTLSYAKSVPIVGETGENWKEAATVRLAAGENDNVVMPFYGADARITTPKK
jgi:tRNA threonylcarbamoyladenosine biosynthesis protein TsaB